MYYLVSNTAELNEAVATLQRLGFEKSKYTAEKEDAKAIATFISENEKHYMFLSEDMMTDNPYTSWIMNRKQVFSLSELVKGVMDTIYFFLEKKYAEN